MGVPDEEIFELISPIQKSSSEEKKIDDYLVAIRRFPF